MNAKFIGILICMLLIINIFVTINSGKIIEKNIVNKDKKIFPVQEIKTLEELQPFLKDNAGSEIGLDYDYIWNVTEHLSNIVNTSYDKDDIPKGRAYGSKGGNDAAGYLLDQMNKIGLEDVQKLKIAHIENIKKDYTSIFDINDFQLTVNNDGYQLPKNIPKKESFVIPSAYPYIPFDSRSLTYNYSFNDVKIMPHNMTYLWPFGGTFNNYSINITSSIILNNTIPCVGIIKYIAPNERIPDSENQYGTVFVLDKTEGWENKLNNLTKASGCILIDQGNQPMAIDTAQKYPFSVLKINSNDGDIIKVLLKKYSEVFVDDVTGHLTLTYNLSDGWWPSSDFVLIDRIPDHFELLNTSTPLLDFINKRYHVKPTIWEYIMLFEANTIFLRLRSHLGPGGDCKGIILYDSYEDHLMLNPTFNWNHTNGIRIPGPALPVFTVNYTVGNFLNHNCNRTMVSGYVNQTFLEETPKCPGVEAYNVIGNISIGHSPGDSIAIISSRYDGWWGQTPGDSGVGVAIVLGIAKYFKDNNIKPKYNLTFLFTTGEEYGLRGAWHYNDSHPNDNITFWLVLDQLAFNQSDTIQEIGSRYNDDLMIVRTITNQTQYEERTGYGLGLTLGAIAGTEQAVYSTRPHCHTICIAKDKNISWDRWHRTGMNYSEGDSLKYIDRNDLNITAEMALNITKYFCVNINRGYENVYYEAVDKSNNGDTVHDSIKTTFTVKKTLPFNLVMINASLTDISREKTFQMCRRIILLSLMTQATIVVSIPDHKNKRVPSLSWPL